MRPAYKQHVREFVKGGRAALVNHSLDGGVRLKDPRNRPSGDPNCELFPQDPIVPVPPSSSPYRPVGICGNNWAVSPDRHAKESLRTRGFGGRYSRYFAGDFALWRRRSSTRRYSAAPKCEFRSQFPLFPLNSKKLSPVCSSLPRFVLVCPNAAQSQKCPRIHGVIFGSRFFGSSGSFSWVTLGHGKLRAATYGAHGRYIPREGKAEKPPTNTLLVATMDPRSSTCTVRSEALSSQCPLPQKRFSAFRFSHKLSFRD